MSKYLVIENSDQLNEQIAIKAGCDMVESTRLYTGYSWGLGIDSPKYLTFDQIDQLINFEDLTPEQKLDVQPEEIE